MVSFAVVFPVLSSTVTYFSPSCETSSLYLYTGSVCVAPKPLRPPLNMTRMASTVKCWTTSKRVAGESSTVMDGCASSAAGIHTVPL